MTDYKAARIEKRDALRARGIDPYGRDWDPRRVTTPIDEVRAHLEKPDFADEKFSFTIAGRIMAVRGHGKASFFDLKDRTGRLQGYVRRDIGGDALMDLFGLFDLGDLIAVTGTLFRTRTGEPTLLVREVVVLAKAVLPMPEKWHGLQDVEIRYRQRYLDLIANDESRAIFIKRSRMVRTIRGYLDERGFMEVETPMMQTIPGGAAARPFKTHHNALDMPLFLRIAPELFLKRLLVGGLERVYEINRNFRNEGISTRHNPEFTMLEVYQACGDFNAMMDLCEGVITAAAREVCPAGTVQFGEHLVNLAGPWPRRAFGDLLREHCGLADMRDDAALQACAAREHIKTAGVPRAQLLDGLFSAGVEPTLVNPTFVTGYPVELCPLSKTTRDDPTLTDRFELFMGCFEVANAYTELNDPEEQARRFKEQAGAGAEGFDGVIDADYVEALSYGMPPAGGLGIGIDRLAMLLLGVTSIRDVILFPILRSAAPEA
ncbi:MAG: lysine--tRNA ligase [Planctomycetota bacterium]